MNTTCPVKRIKNKRNDMMYRYQQFQLKNINKSILLLRTLIVTIIEKTGHSIALNKEYDEKSNTL